MNKIAKIVIGVVEMVALVVLFTIFLRQFVVPVLPLFGLVLVTLATIVAFRSWLTATLAVAGLCVYAFAWLVVDVWEALPAMLCAMVGLILWISGVLWATGIKPPQESGQPT